MTLAEFEKQVILIAMTSSICDIPRVVRLSSTAIKLRLEVPNGDFIDAFYNEETDTTAYALIRQGQRVFGADNTGGWHVYPFTNPARHDKLMDAMSFAEIEREYNKNTGN